MRPTSPWWPSRRGSSSSRAPRSCASSSSPRRSTPSCCCRCCGSSAGSRRDRELMGDHAMSRRGRRAHRPRLRRHRGLRHRARLALALSAVRSSRPAGAVVRRSGWAVRPDARPPRGPSVQPMIKTRVLVAYASRHGSTREVAEAVAATLRARGLAVQVMPAAEVGHVHRLRRRGARRRALHRPPAQGCPPVPAPPREALAAPPARRLRPRPAHAGAGRRRVLARAARPRAVRRAGAGARCRWRSSAAPSSRTSSTSR